MIGAVAIGQFPSRTPLQKYGLAVLNRGENVHSPQNDEKRLSFCGDFFNEKKKKIKVSSPPSENRPGIFKQPSSELRVTSKLHEDQHLVFFNSIVFCLCCLFRLIKALSSLDRSEEGEKGEGGRKQV